MLSYAAMCRVDIAARAGHQRFCTSCANEMYNQQRGYHFSRTAINMSLRLYTDWLSVTCFFVCTCSYLVHLPLPCTFVCSLHYCGFHRAGDEYYLCSCKNIYTFCSVACITFTLAYHTARSCIFHPCDLLLHFPLPLYITLGFWCRIFRSRIFHPCIFYRIAFSTHAFSVAPLIHCAVNLVTVMLSVLWQPVRLFLTNEAVAEFLLIAVNCPRMWAWPECETASQLLFARIGLKVVGSYWVVKLFG